MITNTASAKQSYNDLKTVGDPDSWVLLCKAQSTEGGFTKSTKAMEIPGVGCLVQVSTQIGDQISEAITAVPSVKIVEDVNSGHKLVAI